MLSATLYIGSLKTTTIEESTLFFSNSIVCINKINTSALEDVEEAFILRDIPIKNLKINVKVDGSPMTLAFSLVSSSDRNELLKSGEVINNQTKAVRDYITQDKLV